MELSDNNDNYYILFVEDEKDILDLFTEYLSSSGFNTISVVGCVLFLLLPINYAQLLNIIINTIIYRKTNKKPVIPNNFNIP